MTRRHVLAGCAFAALILANACPESRLLPTGPSPTSVLDEPGRAFVVDAPEGVIVGAGDIANCDTKGAEQTARLLDSIPGTVVTAGDNAYFLGSALDYERCYDPTWGRHKARTRPSPGNHEYETAYGAAYFDYFGDNAGPPGLGYYSFSTGGWLILSLNSSVDSSDASAQSSWLRSTLRANPNRCAMAIFHHPPLASGQNGGSPVMLDIWRTLADAGVDVVMTGHEHLYERFTPMDAWLRPSSTGIRLFIAGTGGTHLSPILAPSPGSEMRIASWGVLKFTLRPGSYDWAFIPVGGGVLDTGHDACR